MAKARRRQVLVAAGALLAAPRISLAQLRSVRIGALGPRQRSILLAPVLKRLAELGYVEGKNLSVVYRSADGFVERFPALARELVQAKCDLILSLGTEHSARALLDAKSDIPIIILAYDYDPVKSGIVASYRRPGGNITGVYVSQSDIAAKRLELLRELVPKAKRILVLSDVFSREQLESVHEAAAKLHVEILVQTVAAPALDFDSAFAHGRAAGIEAVIVLLSPVFLDQRAKIFNLAMKYRLPSAGFPPMFVETGFLITYGMNPEAFSRAGDMAWSILNGARPRDLPVEQPTRFDLAINLKTAKALGISIPESVKLRVNRVIE